VTRSRLATVDVRPVRWPLRRPFVTALGQKSHSDNVLVRVRLTDGTEGWGEASASLAMPWQTGPVLARALRALADRFRGRDVRDIEPLVHDVWVAQGKKAPTAAGAFESAVWDALARHEKTPLCELWGGSRSAVETVLSISALDPDEMGRRARAAVRAGWRLLKLKLNGRDSPAMNRDRLRCVRRNAPRARLLADPNQSYDPDGLQVLLQECRQDGIDIELVEEPFPKGDLDALAEANKRRLGPLICDESIQNEFDAERLCSGFGVWGANIKLAKSGFLGGRAVARACDRARRGRALLMIGCMAESRIGLASAVHFAWGFGGFDYADLDSDLILKPTSAQGGYVRRGPWLERPRFPRPGLGLGVRL
jgi:L-alanine-DL-glutamate epimerase-like enolase superfamily enzyme